MSIERTPEDIARFNADMLRIARSRVNQPEQLESPRYQLTRAEDMIAACIGHAYAKAMNAPKDSEVRVETVWDLKDRLVLEMSLDRPTFNSDVFIARVQHHYELASGY